MALSLVGWLNFITITFMFIVGCGFGIKLIYESKKTNVKLLFFSGLASILLPFVFLGLFIDYITIILTGKNFDNPLLLHTLSFMCFGPIVVLGTYIGSELLIPAYKKYCIPFTLAICIVLEIFLFMDPKQSIELTFPSKPGENAVYSTTVFGTPFFIMWMIGMSLMFGFLVCGALYKAIQSTGLIRKKFLLLFLAFFLYMNCALLYSLFPYGFLYTLLNIGIGIGFWFWYLGLREEPEKKEKVKPKKEIKVEKGIFRISQYKKEDITEEEVSISKEKKICLVCKGKVGKIMFMCPNCETFYCINCSEALSNLENACWVCDAPFDESKPVKPFKKEDEEIEVEVSEKPQKKPKTKK